LSQHRGGRRAVARVIGGLRGNRFCHLRTDILKRIADLDFLRDGNPVLGYGRCTSRSLDQDVASPRPQGLTHGVGQYVDARQDLEARFLRE
jgi:hypothetical protein